MSLSKTPVLPLPSSHGPRITPVTKEPAAQFVRLWVLKPGLEHKERYPRTDFTNIYVPLDDFARMSELAEGRWSAVHAAARLASSRCKKKPDVSWSATVIAGATRILRAEKAKRDDAQLKDCTPELSETLARITTTPWVHCPR